MSTDELLKRQHARGMIDYFLTQHSLHFFRNNTPEQLANDAITLHHYLSVIHRGDQAKVAERMRVLADQIAAYELTDYFFANGHHERAAEAIRATAMEVATAVEVAADAGTNKCPWAVLYPLFGRHRALRTLAQSLWNHNRKKTSEWSVSTDTVAQEVWGGLLTDPSKLRSTVSRLASWLQDRGIIVEFSVNCPAGQGFIVCKIIRVDEAVVQAVL